MTFWSSLMIKSSAALTAFRKPSLISDPYRFDTNYDETDQRRLRYNILWNYYANAAYDDTHKWSKTYKTQYGLDRYIRNIYNPAYRNGEFWRSSIWGGPPLEFETENENLLDPLAQVYSWSNWQVQKDILTLYGAVMGDVALRVRDDVGRKQVYFEVIHPAAIIEKTVDSRGNVKSYVLQEERQDPNRPDRTVIFTEIAIRDGENVFYKTLLDGQPFAWDGIDAEFSEPYGFVPLVFIQHNNVGGEWGWAEMYPGLSKIREIDDLASKTSDQIRKIVDPIWLMIGQSKPTNTPIFSKTQPTNATLSQHPFPGREETNALYVKSENAKAQALIVDLDLPSVREYIKDILAELERDFPELQIDIWAGSGDTSGRALRIARQRVTTKVEQRRATYYDALLRANKMALAIGGFRDYFSSFSLESFEKGELDHTIKTRPVFALDQLDIAEIDQAQAQAIKTEQEALNWPRLFIWRKSLQAEGLSEQEINEVIAQALTDSEQEIVPPEDNDN